MNINLDVAILIFGDSNHYLNEKKQCADELKGLYSLFSFSTTSVKIVFTSSFILRPSCLSLEN